MASYAFQIAIVVTAAMTDNILLLAIVALAVSVQTGTQPVENCLVARYTPDSWRATICYRATAAVDYRLLGAPVPEDAKRGRSEVKPAVDALVARGGPDLSGKGATQEFRRSVLARTSREPDLIDPDRL